MTKGQRASKTSTIFYYFLELMSVELLSLEINEKLINQKYPTLFLSWMPFMDNIGHTWKYFLLAVPLRD